ncbi:MAG: tail fiber domain-containing protein [Saprospiraceae bacterium]|nr:tail fiber domain-containing protein [Saprospiraceae bacterium]MCF8249828.1 tail fiber domain-containing protein [Saprospiraceae bacterium]MCF8279502.1 tail fiber domain-containing protein [Bacteroidales bacterium]MCF8311738.1 tail fiber domain-containing protein [Saprospiraceae bacterium]MCF8440305.1 tail fiber domain-containing protein [Saprospiraceae bacterium]
MKNLFSNPVRFLLCNLLLVLASAQILHAQNNNMGIGTTTPDASAILDITSNTKGLLIPRMEPNTFPSSTSTGLLFYNKGDKVFNYWDGVWRPVGLWNLYGSNAYYSAGNVGIGTNNPLSKLSISPGTAEAKITLWDGGNPATHLGFGVSSGQLNYDVPTGNHHVFYAGGKNGTGTELMRIKADGLNVQTGIRTNTNLVINHSYPTIYLQDTDEMSGFIHQNSNLMYFLNGGVNASTWASPTGSYWPLTLNMANDAATFGGPAYFMEGNVGIGTNSPGSHKLALLTGAFGLKIQNASAGNSYWELWQDGLQNGNFYLYAGFGSVGNFNYSSGVYSATSDRRLKDNITPLNNVLPILLKLEAKNYTYKSDTKKELNIGFIAQDVEKLFPELVTPPSINEKGETPYMMNYAGFGIIAVKAIQEQQVIIETQAKKIEAQQAEIDAIKTALEKAGIKLD